MRIGILTGGGDAPGLNACIKALVERCVEEGHEAIGIRRGWQGLLEIDPGAPESAEGVVVPLDRAAVRAVDRTGGTFLHTSRYNPALVPAREVPAFLGGAGEAAEDGCVDLTGHALAVLESLGVDALVPLGGDDTLGYAARIHREGFPVVSIPKTIDNDVFGTDYCLGFSTAVSSAVGLVRQLRTSFGSHERIGVVELFGRNAGHTALMAGLLSSADRTVICEVPFDSARLAALLAEDRLGSPSRYSVLVIAEGARELGGETYEGGQPDPFGHLKLGGIGMVTAQRIEEHVGVQTMYQRLSYLMRSGAPDNLDVMAGFAFANVALDLAFAGEFGRMVALRGGRYTDVDAATPSEGIRTVDAEALYDPAEYRPRIRDLRGRPMLL